MTPEARRHAEAVLRDGQLEAVYLEARLSARDKTRPLTFGLKSRIRAIDHYFDKQTALALESARLAGKQSALQEVGDEDGLTEIYARLGVWRAERVRLDARLEAELQALATTQRLLGIRLSVA